MILDLHHVQLAMPAGGEDDARRFYGGTFGMTEILKPQALLSRGGVWFEMGSARLHLGVETPFVPARKAHPALRVRSVKETIATLRAHHVDFRPGVDLPGMRRIFVNDPFGNRIELLELV